MDGVPRGGMSHVHSNCHRPFVWLEETGLKSDSPNHVKTLKPHSGQGVNLEMVYRSLLRIIARLDETQYTQGTLRQTEVVEHSDLADPASAVNTSQG
jgi:hypothetical protein